MDAEDSILNRDELDLIFFDEYFPEEHGAEDFLGLLGKAVPASSAAGAVASAPAAASAEPALSAESAPKRKKASPAATALSSPDEHRREINRRNARKTRLRKKFKMEGLLVRHAQLEEENRLLRSALEGSGVKPPPRKAPHDFEVPADDTSGTFSAFSQGQILPRDQAMISALSLGCSNFILTNPALPDNPICFVSPGFLQMSGYTKEEVVGRNCRFMQAPETDEATNQKIRDGIRNKADVAVTILNKRKDGSTFWNQLFVAPVVDQHGEAKFFVGVQRPIKVLPRGGAETPAEDDEDGSSGSA